MFITGKMISLSWDFINLQGICQFAFNFFCDLKQIVIETRFEPQSGILYMGNGEMLDVARNMVPTNEYPSEEKPTKPVVDKNNFQMVDDCKLLANIVLNI